MIDIHGRSALEIERIKNGYSRKQVGEALNVTDRTIYDYEHGNTIPTKLSTIVTLCKLYNLSASQLCYILVQTQEETKKTTPIDNTSNLIDLAELCSDSQNSDLLDSITAEELLPPTNPIKEVAAYFENDSISEYEKINFLIETIRLYLLHQNGFEHPVTYDDIDLL